MRRSRAQVLLAVALRLRGELAEAERVLVSGIAGWQAAGQHTVTAWGCYHLGQAHVARVAWTRPRRPSSGH